MVTGSVACGGGSEAQVQGVLTPWTQKKNMDKHVISLDIYKLQIDRHNNVYGKHEYNFLGASISFLKFP